MCILKSLCASAGIGEDYRPPSVPRRNQKTSTRNLNITVRRAQRAQIHVLIFKNQGTWQEEEQIH